jgi:hypothetical protein
MTAFTDLSAISLTANAKAVGSASGVDLVGLITQTKLDIIELQNRLKQIVKIHPTGGGDAANYAALNSVIAELA